MNAPPHGPKDSTDIRGSVPRQRKAVGQLLSEFGASVSDSLGRGGQEEDQLRRPLQSILESMGAILGIPVKVYGEVQLPALKARPDFGVDAAGVSAGPHNRIGYVELKKPSKAIPPSEFLDQRDREQWKKFQSLPNILYSNGTQWAVFRYGKQQGTTVETPRITREHRNSTISTLEFEKLIWEFLAWEPNPDYTLDQLITRVAGLCRRLREEVAQFIAEEQWSSGRKPFTRLAEEWRNLLFPQLKAGPEFADSYAQTITFALILARESGADFSGRSVHDIGELLAKRHPFLGNALDVLTDPRYVQQLTVLPTLIRILEPIDWQRLMRNERNAYVDLYETFLSRYDPELRKQTGSYYTPEPVTRYMVEFVDEVLKTRMARPRGLADEAVTTLDPAMGTGTFLSSVIDSVARTLTDQYGEVHARTHLKELYRERLVGFERNAGPFAVAELRLHQQMRDRYRVEVPDQHQRYLVNTLDNPYHPYPSFGLRYEEIEYLRDEANRVKRTTPVMVVVGNPPYIERARQRDPAPWLEDRRTDPDRDPMTARPSLDEFREPGNGRLEYKLSAVGTYFWRWAMWKVFDAQPEQPSGIVAFVSTSAYLTQRAFVGMRRYLRATADEGWVIDLSPEGHQPPVSTRIFGGVQQPICISIFARYGRPNPDEPARIWRTRLDGDREAKFATLANDLGLRLDGARWEECASDWTAPLSTEKAEWHTYPALGDLLPWRHSGVKANRRWVIAPDESTLHHRFNRLASAAPQDKDRLFKATRDRDVTRGFPGRRTITEENKSPGQDRLLHRSFDRQRFISDTRFVDFIRPPLWNAHGDKQVFVIEQHAHPLTSGPGLHFSSLVPDMHCFNGRGGRTLPLYRDRETTSPNLALGLLVTISERVGRRVSAEDLIAYLAAIVAHPGYTAQFKDDLVVPGIRVPLTSDADTWSEAVALGREVVWLHTYGERFCDAAAGRPQRTPRLPRDRKPEVVAEVPGSPAPLPDIIRHDSDSAVPGDRLYIGEGVIKQVPREVWRYDVGGMPIVRKWFSARQLNPRHQRRGAPLDYIRPEHWTPQFTDELLELLTVLTRLVDLEPRQDELLDRVLSGPIVTTQDLMVADVLPVKPGLRKPPRLHGQTELPLD
ncbi:N-6 DNA methylase [Murinocardiopsis flavida]|uniref:site-specific DNA-methyltransferase (adenine-specific) n=2 Tax=Murinocardiopsis flavida TaxID=645275 RepID=A0A2P8DET9_9ACTN|nr:N-6 DNA methylase [Murinocardiopsis flavida]